MSPSKQNCNGVLFLILVNITQFVDHAYHDLYRHIDSGVEITNLAVNCKIRTMHEISIDLFPNRATLLVSLKMASPPKKARTDSDLYLIGSEEHQIIGDKLPSNRQVLAVFSHNTRKLHFNYVDSAALVIDEVKVFWSKARIPTSRHDNCCRKLIKLYKKWRNLGKGNKTAKTDKHIQNEIAFQSKLDDLFDVAAGDALSKLNGDAKSFLLSQQRKGRVGSLLQIDQTCTEREMKQSERKGKEEQRKRKCANELKNQCKSEKKISLLADV